MKKQLAKFLVRQAARLDLFRAESQMTKCVEAWEESVEDDLYVEDEDRRGRKSGLATRRDTSYGGQSLALTRRQATTSFLME